MFIIIRFSPKLIKHTCIQTYGASQGMATSVDPTTLFQVLKCSTSGLRPISMIRPTSLCSPLPCNSFWRNNFLWLGRPFREWFVGTSPKTFRSATWSMLSGHQILPTTNSINLLKRWDTIRALRKCMTQVVVFSFLMPRRPYL